MAVVFWLNDYAVMLVQEKLSICTTWCT